VLHAMRQIMRKDKTHYRQISSMTHGGVTREMRCVYGKKAKHVLVLAFIFFQIQAMHHFYFVLLHNCNCILARAPKSITDKLHRWLLQRMPGTWKLTCSRAWTSASEDFYFSLYKCAHYYYYYYWMPPLVSSATPASLTSAWYVFCTPICID